jgi:threonine/homoserine/homoserine lactone efflux protein
MDPKAILDHQFTVAAYVITWVIQLSYLAWLGMRWRAQRRKNSRAAHDPR